MGRSVCILLLIISVYVGTIAKETRPKDANQIKHSNKTEQSPWKRDWIYGWGAQPEVPMYAPQGASSNSEIMPQYGGNTRGFVAQTKPSPGWRTQPEVPMYGSQGSIYNTGLMRQDSGTTHGFVAQTNPIPGLQTQPEVPMYAPQRTRYNTGLMRQDSGYNRGFVPQTKPSLALPYVSRGSRKGSKLRTLHKGSDKTKKPLPAIIKSAKGANHLAKTTNGQKKNPTTKPRQTKPQPKTSSDDSTARSGGRGLGSTLKEAKIQDAVAEKGIEVMGKLVDKQLQIIDEVQEMAEYFLKKEINLDIVPEDMFVPADYESSPKEVGEPPYTYPAGVGNVLMNGCWGTGYKEGDPCYAARWKMKACLNLIDGAAFMGVGFDGRGEYSPESRKMSIVQRNCAEKATYGDYDVPDTMNVHSIYDTKASMVTFESRGEFQKYLQEEAGVSGSYFGFYAGVKSGWGETQDSQTYMTLLHVDIVRYEIFIDEVKPNDLSAAFLKEFMDLPTSYFAAAAPLKYLDFIQRWGTHYIKSAKLGGQLQIRKFMDASDVSSKKDFAREMEVEFRYLFAGAEGESQRPQAKTTSTAILAMGGSQQIASILSDAYSPTFKNEFKDWLSSIPRYPKPFEFKMAPITTLLNFRLHDLFPEEKSKWGCEGNAANLQEEVTVNEERLKFYETVDSNGTVQKHYCQFDSRKSLEEALVRRRISLSRAIEVYMKEGQDSITDIQLPPCSTDTLAAGGSETPASGIDTPSAGTENTSQVDVVVNRSPLPVPIWRHITKDKATFRVILDMRNDLKGTKDFSDIPRNMSRLVRYNEGKWFTAEKDGSFHLYNAFKNGNSGDPRQHKLSILGLVLSFDENTGGLSLLSRDIEASREFFPDLHDALAERELGRVFVELGVPGNKKKKGVDSPCNVKWSNALRFDPTETKGKCLHFTASSEGKIFVVFATLPIDKTSWYYIEVTPQKVAIYKGFELKTSTTNINARGLGDPSLLQSYFVCITESKSSTLIEYGKTLGTTQSGDVYLNMLDLNKPLNTRFYAFGNGNKKADVIDAHIVARDQTKAECKGDTFMDLTSKLCTQHCHEDCDPLYGCNTQSPGNPLPTECNVCRVAKDETSGSCLSECPAGKYLTADKFCHDLSATYDMEFLAEDPDGVNRAQVKDVPELPALTLCFWFRLTQGSIKKSFFMYPIIEYKSGSVTFTLALAGQETDVNLDLNFSGSGKQLSLAILSDRNWHHICVTWAGHSGVTLQYLDGVRKLADTRMIGSLEGGGVLSIGHFTQYTYQITGLNLWDKVIAPVDIAEFSKGCEKGSGNVKTWADFYSNARAENLTIYTPSACRVGQLGVTAQRNN